MRKGTQVKMLSQNGREDDDDHEPAGGRQLAQLLLRFLLLVARRLRGGRHWLPKPSRRLALCQDWIKNFTPNIFNSYACGTAPRVRFAFISL